MIHLSCYFVSFTSCSFLQICFCLFAVAAVSAQFFPARVGFPLVPFPFGFPYGFPVAEDVYAASLGGARVGLYGKNRPFGNGGFPGFPGFSGFPGFGSTSDVTGASLGGAKVGLYGKERPCKYLIIYLFPLFNTFKVRD